jgi:hypothetical protein
MDGNLFAVVHTAKQLALLAEALERRSETAVSTQRSAAFALTRAASEAKEAVDTLTLTASRDVEKATSAAVEDVLGRSLSAFHRQVVISSEQVEATSGLIYASGQMVRSVMVRQIKIAYLAVAGAITLVAVGAVVAQASGQPTHASSATTPSVSSSSLSETRTTPDKYWA